MIHDRTILCFASNWFYDPTSKHHIMKLLAENNHVVWVNYHASRRPTISAADAGAVVGKLRQVIEGPRRVAENITVLTPLVIPLPGSRAATALNRRLLVRQIRNVLRTLPPRPVQLWSFAPDIDYLVGRFDEEAVVYYCVDAFSEFTGYNRAAIDSAEARLCKKADLVITTAQSLYDAKRPLNNNTSLITHGVDYDHFEKAADADTNIPPDIADIPRPILGFWGLIQDWIDTDLLASIARQRPDWSIVLIGEEATDCSALRNLRNVHLLGRRPHESLPAYAKAMTVGLIPFRRNALTEAVNPIKLREYLSAGLHVVSTPLPEVRRYEQWVHPANSPAEWITAIADALTNHSPEKAAARRQAMQCETWSAKLDEIQTRLTHALAHRQPTESIR
ncbi:MAG: glycosyltransferase [Planctomycetota bacterium]